MSTATSSRAGFTFGKNWERFVRSCLDPDRVEIARRHLLDFLKLPDLAGRTILDIGCGSGIHSLGAWRSGAGRVVGFDVDPDSVAATRRVRELTGNPANWEVLQGSVLDPGFLGGIEPADVIYSWGVLHHTGAMWDALAAAAGRLKDDGVLYVALYCSDVYIDPPPEHWLEVKQRYNRSSRLRQRWMEWQYAWRYTIRPALGERRNPLKIVRGYRRSRGMSYWTDVRDWLGGWPMEFASIAETKRFCGDQLGLELIHIRAGAGNTEYLFRKQGARNYWDQILAQRQLIPLPRPFVHRGGHCWQAKVPGLADRADVPTLPERSRLMVYEDGVPVGFAHAPHAHIELYGTGRYSHWGPDLFFSATDNSDPNENRREYTVCADGL